MSQTNSRLQGGALILPQGSSPGNIAVGEKALIVDSDGAVKAQDSAGTKTDVGGGGFGADTIVQLPNASAVNVNAIRITTTLPTATAGSEVSQTNFIMLAAGAASTTLQLKGAQVLLPTGTSSVPSLGFQADATTGMWFDSGNGGVGFITGGGYRGLIRNGGLWLLDGGASVLLGVSNSTVLERNTSGGMQIRSTIHDVTIGADGALATNATVGHLEIPSCAGTPTGTVTPRAGKVVLVYDSTNFKLAVSAGGGTWKQTAALT